MEELQFNQSDSGYSCNLLPAQNKGIIQVKIDGQVSVSANLTGMNPSVVSVFDNPYGDSVIFAVDFPEGVDVELRTSKEPVKALWKQSE